MAAAGQNPPKAERRFKSWRLTPVLNCSRFCSAIRDCSEGNRECVWSDLSYAAQAYEAGAPVVYTSSCCFAVILLTGEDITREGKKRARQNVIHEKDQAR